MSTVRGTDVYIGIHEQVDLYTPALDTQLITGDFLAFENEGLQGGRKLVQSRSTRAGAWRS